MDVVSLLLGRHIYGGHVCFGQHTVSFDFPPSFFSFLIIPCAAAGIWVLALAWNRSLDDIRNYLQFYDKLLIFLNESSVLTCLSWLCTSASCNPISQWFLTYEMFVFMLVLAMDEMLAQHRWIQVALLIFCLNATYKC